MNIPCLTRDFHGTPGRAGPTVVRRYSPVASTGSRPNDRSHAS